MSESTDEQIERLERSLTNQAPIDEVIVGQFETLRSPAKAFARQIILTCPQSREQSIALTKLEESLMWAVKAIALNQEQILEEWGIFWDGDLGGS